MILFGEWPVQVSSHRCNCPRPWRPNAAAKQPIAVRIREPESGTAVVIVAVIPVESPTAPPFAVTPKSIVDPGVTATSMSNGTGGPGGPPLGTGALNTLTPFTVTNPLVSPPGSRSKNEPWIRTNPE